MLVTNAIVEIKDVTQAQTGVKWFICDILQAEGAQAVFKFVKRLVNYMCHEDLINRECVVEISISGSSVFETVTLGILITYMNWYQAVVGGNDK